MMRLFSLPFIPFMENKKLLLAISSGFVLFSLFSLLVFRLNPGIDFVGGILFEAKTTASISELRGKINRLDLGNFSLQSFGSDDVILIRIERQQGGDKGQQLAVERLKTSLSDDIIEFRRIEVVGPTIGTELQKQAFFSMIFALLAITFYIWFRFEWQFGVGAICALFHDILITLGFYSLSQIEFNISLVAALLTIAGYSINDTVVIYDRFRENLGKYKKKSIEDIIDMSLNQVLSRTIITSLTTLLALLALVFLGGTIIRNFALGMVVGVIAGTWSSISVASLFLTKFRPVFEEEVRRP